MSYPYQIKSYEQYKEAYKKSVDDPEGFWGNIADNFQWRKKWDKVLNWNFTEPKIEWFKGVSTITEVSTALMFDVEDAECKPIEVTYYILDTNYYFKDEPDGIMEEDILRVIKER